MTDASSESPTGLPQPSVPAPGHSSAPPGTPGGNSPQTPPAAGTDDRLLTQLQQEGDVTVIGTSIAELALACRILGIDATTALVVGRIYVR